jgi:AcrR family transcriptional regulator
MNPVNLVAPRTNADVWERKRVRTSLEIERAGLALLSARGLGEVTVEQIAAAAGISTRTFFRYFRNVRDVLTAVPRRESERMHTALMARPPDESLLDALHAVYLGDALTAGTSGENADLELETLTLWGRIVRAAPDEVAAESKVTSVLARALDDVVRARLDLAPDDDEAVGVVCAALASVVWFVYVRYNDHDDGEPLAVHLDRAFNTMGALSGVPRGRRI